MTTASNCCWLFPTRCSFPDFDDGLVRPGKAQGGLCDEVENHLAADRRGAHESCHEPQLGESVLVSQAVSAMGLDRLVQRLQRSFRRGELRDIRSLPSRFAGVEQSRAADSGQTPQLDCDVRFGEGMRYPLVRADRGGPHLALLGVVNGFADRVAPDTATQ